MAFPAAFLDELRNRISLAALIGRRVKLARKGREHMGLCPFHNEKTPSFTVSEDKGFYHCFGCGAHGDAIGFLMRAERLSFLEAVERLAAEAGLEVPKSSPEERERAKKQATLLDAVEAACAFYQRELRAPGGRAALDYLRSRGLDDETIARFRLGYAPTQRGVLAGALEKAGVSRALALEAGVLGQPEGGGETFDRFRGRVIFPIADRRGRIVAFGGRILGEGQPKYLNSPDGPLFHKGEMLYGLALARAAIAEQETVLVCEGYMDVIALHRAGFAHAVAPLGTALTERQIELLWRFAPEPILCLDGDEAGRRAALRAAQRALPLLKPGMSLRFAMLPAGEDPDSLLRARGPQAMREVLDAAQPLSELVWAAALSAHATDTPERRAALAKDLADTAAAIGDARVRDEYRRHFEARFRAHFAPSRSPWRDGRGPRLADRGPDGRLRGAGRPHPPASDRSSRERCLLFPLLAHPALLDRVAEQLGGLHLADPALDSLRQALLSGQDELRGLDSGAVQDYLRAGGLTQVVDGVLDANAHESWAFRRSANTLDKAIASWEDALRHYVRTDMAADIAEARDRLGRDLSERNLAALAALMAEMERQDQDRRDLEI